jgi:putative membrane protein
VYGYGPSGGMMGYGAGWGGAGWMMVFGGILWILLLALAVIAVVWGVRSLSGRGTELLRPDRRSAALDILEERYARGEIGRDEYLQKKADVLGGGATGQR